MSIPRCVWLLCVLLKAVPSNTLVRKGEASGSPMSVRAALYIIVGHEKHHCAVIKERYL